MISVEYIVDSITFPETMRWKVSSPVSKKRLWRITFVASSVILSTGSSKTSSIVLSIKLNIRNSKSRGPVISSFTVTTRGLIVPRAVTGRLTVSMTKEDV